MKTFFITILLFLLSFSYGITPRYGAIAIRDTNGAYLDIESNGAMAVNIQDQHSAIVDYHVHRDIDTTSITAASVIDSVFIVVADTSSMNTGHLVYMKTARRYYEGKITSISNDTAFLDTPLDTIFPVNQVVRIGSDSLNIDASGGIVQAHVEPPDSVDWDITRMIVYIQGSGAMDDAKFGDQTALAKGIVFRVNNGSVLNIFSAATNGDLAQHMYDVTYSDKAGGGSNAIRGRRTFAGQSKNGVTIRLIGTTDDEFQILLQDDMDGLEKFNVVIQGHVVTD